MHKSIWIIIKKECSRFLKDWRMIRNVVIFPALLMYGIYALMGLGFNSMLSVDEDYAFHCYVQNPPAAYEAVFESLGFTVEQTHDPEEAKSLVTQKEGDLVVLFPEDFDSKLAVSSGAGQVPNIQVYYNSDTMESLEAYTLFMDAAEQLETSIVNIWDINRDVAQPDIAQGTSFIMSAVPMVIIMLLFTCCSSFAPESIAGEKERGTFATLLVTPVSRTAIAVGKIISLSLFATLAGFSNFLGMMLGMRTMVSGVTENVLPAYGATEYLLLLALIVSAVLMTISIISVISAYSKSVKEANAAAAMVTGVASLASMVTQFSDSFSGFGWYCAPILGTAINLNDLLTMEYTVSAILVTCACNLLCMLLMVTVLSKMFNSEKIMFCKS